MANQIDFPDNDVKNINLALEQVNKLIDAHSKAIQQLDWKLGTGIGLAGLFLKSSVDLPDSQPAYLVCKALALVGVIGCASFCLMGFLPQASENGYVSPSALMHEYFQWRNEQVIATLVVTNIEIEKEMKQKSHQKVERLKKALTCLTISVVSTGASQLIFMIFGQ